MHSRLNLFFLAFAFATLALSPNAESANGTAEDAKKVELCQRMASEIDAGLPKRIDAMTTLTAVRCNENTMIFDHAITGATWSDIFANKEKLTPFVTSLICDNEMRRKLTQKNIINFSVIYRGADGGPVKFDVTCK